jgi:glycosyltransferase involved in cell wall biosynthesis
MVLPIRVAILRLLYRLAVAMKGILAPLIPVHIRYQIKIKLLGLDRPVSKGRKNKTLTGTGGVNLIGYARAEMGIGESCRIAARNLDAAGIPFGIINFTGTNKARMSDLSWSHKEVNEPVHNINIVHLNAEQMIELYTEYGADLFENRCTIGYWHWELPDFPDRWLNSFSLVDEVWVPSNFVADSIAMKSPVPVVKIPHSVQVVISTPRDRAYFGLPEDRFLFLCMFDLNSYQVRKNPQAAIEAFKTAFFDRGKDVGLVLKVNGFANNKEELRKLRDSVNDFENIYITAETLTRNDTNALMNVVDCYVSLHRSEGFGLGLAESMFLGKPVIGTAWSGNIDFMTPFNSCLVNYRLVQLGATYGPYEAYQHWAEPDIEHAAHFMRKLVEDRTYYDRLSKAGQKDIIEHFSPMAVGALIKQRISYIRNYNFRR